MVSEEYLKQVTVGKRDKHNDRILLKEYDGSWPELFRQEAGKITAALGADALLVEHVGSTSVSGLCAKPVLDILLLVENPADESRYVPQLEQAGYVLRIREPDWFEHRLFKGETPKVNLHVLAQGCPEAGRMLCFRDWLRSHEEDRLLYAKTKQQLASQNWKYVQNYADAKSDVVQEILKRAQSANEE